jgi:hypothetical protein
MNEDTKTPGSGAKPSGTNTLQNPNLLSPTPQRESSLKTPLNLGNSMNLQRSLRQSIIQSNQGIPSISKGFTHDHGINTPKINNEVFARKGMTVSETYYNEFQCPVNIKLAEEHRLATMVTSLSGDNEEIGPDDICKCCQLPIIGKKIPLCTNNEGLEFLGVGFPMYFEYLKSRGLILLVSFMVLGGYRFFYYTTGGQCEPYSRCTSYNLGYLMVSNTDFTAPDPTDGILVCLLFGIYWLYLVLSIYFARRRVVMYNSRNLTPASYTVMVRGLPKHETAKTIKDFFCKKMNEEKMGYIVKDVNVNCGYKIQSLFNLWKEKEKLCKYIYKEKALQISRLEKKDALLRMKTNKQAAGGSKNLSSEVPILEAKRVSVAPKKEIFFSNTQKLEDSLESNQVQSLMGYSQSHRDGNQD